MEVKEKLIKIVFVGKDSHINTKSDLFFIDWLKTFSEVVVIRKKNQKGIVKEINEVCPSVVIFWQTPPSPSKHLVRLKCRKIIWIPMWEITLPKLLNWQRKAFFKLTGVRVINFSAKADQYIRSLGLRSIQVQYYPEPLNSIAEPTAEPPYVFFLWQRHPSINIDTIVKLVGEERIRKVIFKSDFSYSNSHSYPFQVEYLDEWLDKDQYLSKVAETDYYIGARLDEGIGFSFIEAMNLGKIVIAYDEATMNEYIRDGVNGHLFGDDYVLSSEISSPAQMRKDLLVSNELGFKRWQDDKNTIKNFITDLAVL